MGTLFTFISIESLKGALASLLHQLGKILFTIFVFVSILTIIFPLLPNDPFRLDILAFAATVKPYAAWINYFVDVPLIVAVFLFYAAWRYVYWVYRRLGGIVMESNGQLSFDA